MRILKIILMMTLYFSSACSAGDSGSNKKDKRAQKNIAATLKEKNNETCPVCGLKFKRSEAISQVLYKGEEYYFFLEDHKRAFKKEPKKFLSKK